MGAGQLGIDDHCPFMTNMSSEDVLPWFDQQLRHIAAARGCLVIAAEGFDLSMGNQPTAAYQATTLRSWLLNRGFLAPTAMVVVRSPRLEHLESGWSFFRSKEGWPGFREWSCHVLTTRPPHPAFAWAAGGLALAQTYLRLGWNVVVVDSNGAKGEGLDIADVVACQFLRLPGCVSGKASSPLATNTQNARVHNDNDLDPATRLELDSILQGEDCEAIAWLNSQSNVTLLPASTSLSRRCNGSRPQSLTREAYVQVHCADAAARGYWVGKEYHPFNKGGYGHA